MDRFTEDQRSNRVPGCVLHDQPLVNLFDLLREFRRRAENLAIAQANFDAGHGRPSHLDAAQAQYDKALASMLAADQTVRCGTS